MPENQRGGENSRSQGNIGRRGYFGGRRVDQPNIVYYKCRELRHKAYECPENLHTTSRQDARSHGVDNETGLTVKINYVEVVSVESLKLTVQRTLLHSTQQEERDPI